MAIRPIDVLLLMIPVLCLAYAMVKASVLLMVVGGIAVAVVWLRFALMAYAFHRGVVFLARLRTQIVQQCEDKLARSLHPDELELIDARMNAWLDEQMNGVSA